jgi:hypothetical protein
MKRQYCSPSERGATLLVFLVVLLSLLTLSGLAVDSGNLYSTQLAVQTAADAGALAGAALKVRLLTATGQQAADAAKDILDVNLRLRGISNYVLNPPPQWKAAKNQMSVSITVPTRLLLMGAIPGIGSNVRNVSAQAVAEVLPANVAIILDTSESMACPAEPNPADGACSCAPNCDQTVGSSKIGALKKAVNQFVDLFDPGRDRMSLTAIGTGAEVLVKMKKNNFTPADIKKAVNSLIAQGATNTCDGFLRAYLDAKNAVQKNGSTPVAYVYFSDGAPTAARFWFKKAMKINEHGPNYKKNHKGIDYDYLSWGLTRPNSSGIATAVASQFYETPPDDSSKQYYWQPRLLDKPDPRVPPALDMGNSGEPDYKPYCESSPSYCVNPDNPVAHLQAAVPDGFEILLPDMTTSSKLGYNWKSNGTYDWAKWGALDHLRLYSDCSLVMSDLLRDEGGIFYSIGYGLQAQKSPDPYQNAGNPTERKDIFLGRVSCDPCGILDAHPDFPGVDPLAKKMTKAQQSGGYYPMADLEQLEEIFVRIASRIKLRLIK